MVKEELDRRRGIERRGGRGGIDRQRKRQLRKRNTKKKLSKEVTSLVLACGCDGASHPFSRPS